MYVYANGYIMVLSLTGYSTSTFVCRYHQLSNDVLKSLQGTQNEWLIQMLGLFNSGMMVEVEEEEREER